MWQFVVIVLCIGINALLAASELAFVALSNPRLKKMAQEGQKAAERVLALRETPERTLSVIQVGITFVGIVAAAVGGVGIDSWLGPKLMSQFQLSKGMSEVLSILFFVVPFTFINVVLSELLPKSLALRNPKWVIFHTDKTLIFLEKLFAPVVFLLEKSTKFCAKFFFSWVKGEEAAPEQVFSVGKILHPYMVNLANIETKRVGDIMIPWVETDRISKDAPIEEVKQMVLKTKHTRLPVVKDEVPMGLLQTKEFLSSLEEKDLQWQDHLLDLIRLTEEDSLIHALKLMQEHRSHMSIVFRGEVPVGMITIEDILETVVGEIYDEDDVLQKIKFS